MIDGDVAGTCAEECQRDQDCHGEGKCCSNGCGHVCMTPIPGGLEIEIESAYCKNGVKKNIPEKVSSSVLSIHDIIDQNLST